MIQTIIVAFLVLAAAVFVVRKLYMAFFSKDASCEGCAVHKTLTS